MKLTNKDKEYLKKLGYTSIDFAQIEQATGKTNYTLCDENSGKETTINREKAIEVLGREKYLSGISRSAFHWSAVRETETENIYVYFDSSKLFR